MVRELPGPPRRAAERRHLQPGLAALGREESGHGRKPGRRHPLHPCTIARGCDTPRRGSRRVPRGGAARVPSDGGSAAVAEPARPRDRPARRAGLRRADRRAAVPARRHRDRRPPRHPASSAASPSRPSCSPRPSGSSTSSPTPPPAPWPATSVPATSAPRPSTASTASGSRSRSASGSPSRACSPSRSSPPRWARPTAVRPYAAEYLRISLLGSPFVLVALAGAGYLRGTQDTRTTLLVAVGANVANLAIELVLVYGFDTGIAGFGVGHRRRPGRRRTRVRGDRARPGPPPHRATFRPRRAGIRAAAVVGSQLVVRTGSLLARLARDDRGRGPHLGHRAREPSDRVPDLGVPRPRAGRHRHRRPGTRRPLPRRRRRPRGPDGRPPHARARRRRRHRGRGRWSRSRGPGSCVPFTSDASVRDLAEQVLWFVAVLQPVAAAVFVFDGILIGAGRRAVPGRRDGGRVRRLPRAARGRDRARRGAALAVGGVLDLDRAPVARAVPAIPHATAGSSPAPCAHPDHGPRAARPRVATAASTRFPLPVSPSPDEPGAPAQRLVAAPDPEPATARRRSRPRARFRRRRSSSRPATPPPGGSRSCPPRGRSAWTSPITNRASGAATSTHRAGARTCARSPRRVYDPMYKYWFRAEWEGLEHIPRDGGALLVANHAGAIPADAPVIMHGIEQELHRPVYGLAENLFRAIPVVGTMWSRLGGVAAHPDNAFRLLHDDHQLVLVFPEGTKGTGKTYRDRYKLHRFGRAGFVEIAMRSGVPGDPDRGRRQRGGDADHVQEPAHRRAAEHPVRAGHREHARVRPARRRASTSRPSSASGCCRRCTSASPPTRSATRVRR